jgi:hypothetical protein
VEDGLVAEEAVIGTDTTLFQEALLLLPFIAEAIFATNQKSIEMLPLGVAVDRLLKLATERRHLAAKALVLSETAHFVINSIMDEMVLRLFPGVVKHRVP